jgi:hypothetical protein
MEEFLMDNQISITKILKWLDQSVVKRDLLLQIEEITYNLESVKKALDLRTLVLWI